MPSFYFLWNPEKRPDLKEELGKDARLLAAGKRPEVWNWSTGSRTRKDFPPGSLFFLVRTEMDPRGVIGYGTIPTGELEPGEHPWKEGKKAAYVKGDPENLIDWEQDPHKVV
jgi:hypothetical protein